MLTLELVHEQFSLTSDNSTNAVVKNVFAQQNGNIFHEDQCSKSRRL